MRAMLSRRILIIEDERDMAELVAMRLKREHYEVDVAFDGARGLSEARVSPPDLVILDVMLPGISGTDVLKELRSDPRTANVPVILLTARTEESDVLLGLHLGADDYVTKPFSLSVLAARIAAVLRRSDSSARPDAGLLRAGPITVDLDAHRVDVEGKAISLTLTEFRLLAAIVAGRGRVLTRNQLIDHAIGPDAIVTDRTIDVHLTGLRRKLGEARTCVHTVRGVGYRLADEKDETA